MFDGINKEKKFLFCNIKLIKVKFINKFVFNIKVFIIKFVVVKL